MGEKTTKIQIRLSPADLELLRQVAAAEGVNMTQWITNRIRSANDTLDKAELEYLRKMCSRALEIFQKLGFGDPGTYRAQWLEDYEKGY